MAKQGGTIEITGTICNVCFYKLYDDYYARQKSSLSGKREKKDPVFKETMRYAKLLARASVIASHIYRRLPKSIKKRRVYQELTGKTINMFKDRMDEKEVILFLHPE